MSDVDSLFGSPPPSPQRRRSPSLALPEGGEWRSMDAHTPAPMAQVETQNVGTIALPGSHNRSELSVVSQPALPTAQSSANRITAEATSKSKHKRPPHRPPRIIQPGIPDSVVNVGGRPFLQLMPREVRQKQGQSQTPTPPRTLRDLTSNVSNHISMSCTNSPKHPNTSGYPSRASSAAPLGTQENPIPVEDVASAEDAVASVNKSIAALASTAASALKLQDKPVASKPGSPPNIETVLYYIKSDTKLVPTLQAVSQYLGNLGQCTPAANLGKGRTVLGELLAMFERCFGKAKGQDSQSIPSTKDSEPPRKRQRILPPKTDVLQNALGQTSSAPQRATSVDSDRMNEWLASVNSSLDPTSGTKEPAVSQSQLDPNTDTQTNDHFDFMSLFGTGPVFNESWNNPNTGEIDFSTLLDGFDIGPAAAPTGDIDWDTLLPSGTSLDFIPPVPNDFQLPATQPATVDAVPSSENPQQEVTQTTELEGFPGFNPDILGLSSLSMPETVTGGPQMDTRTQDIPMDIDKVDKPVDDQITAAAPRLQIDTNTDGVPMDVDNTDNQSVGGQSLYTIPTSSGASAYNGDTPGTPLTPAVAPTLKLPAPSLPAPMLYAPNLPAPGLSTPSTTPMGPLAQRAQRKAIALEKARQYRQRILNELQRVRLERWELMIEGGVLQNLEKALSESPSLPP